MRVKLGFDEIIVKFVKEMCACCQNMQESLNKNDIVYEESIERFSIFDSKIPIEYCPYCGEKIEIEG